MRSFISVDIDQSFVRRTAIAGVLLVGLGACTPPNDVTLGDSPVETSEPESETLTQTATEPSDTSESPDTDPESLDKPDVVNEMDTVDGETTGGETTGYDTAPDETAVDVVSDIETEEFVTPDGDESSYAETIPTAIPEDLEDENEEFVCQADKDVVLNLSPDDSNSMSSPVQARNAILGDGYLSSVNLRVWEFMNYYHFDYPVAEAGELNLSAQMVEAGTTNISASYELQLAVTSETIAFSDRDPMNITLVLDTSGSMAGTPMELLKESCRAMAASLRDGDIVSIVEWNTVNSVVLEKHAITGADDPTLLAAIDALEHGGGTDLNGGLTAGYKIANELWKKDSINRLVLVSDGGANAGITEHDLIAENAAVNGADGIYLVGVGTSGGGYNDKLMDTVTDAGKGAAVFIESNEEAWKMFNDQFVNTMAVAARDVSVQVTFPPGFQVVTFSGEEIATEIVPVEPQHLAPNDSMIFYQEIETCAPDQVNDNSEVKVTVTYKDAVTFEKKSTEKTYTFGDLLKPSADRDMLKKGRAIFLYTAALRAKQEASEDYDDAMIAANDALEDAMQALPGDLDLEEIQEILNAVR